MVALTLFLTRSYKITTVLCKSLATYHFFIFYNKPDFLKQLIFRLFEGFVWTLSPFSLISSAILVPDHFFLFVTPPNTDP